MRSRLGVGAAIVVDMQKLISLAKRRGFVFQSSEIYGGLKSCYDYGPLGVELKRNIADLWWKNIVQSREDVVGLDASILMHPKVWQASGHLAGFSDPLVDCKNCKERFRADKAPKVTQGTEVSYKGAQDKKTHTGSSRGYVCPSCGCPELSEERDFQLMFRSSIGPVDPIGDIIQAVQKCDDPSRLREKIREAVDKSAIYLRPETAQAMFVQFLNVQQSMSMKVPFGIAQIGKSFRNEIVTEHFIFRSCEFEQMEMEFFVEPGTQKDWLQYWAKNRLDWYKGLANNPEHFRLRQHEADERAHYADDCYDIEYNYPWGYDELEGVASRTDYDLKKHAEHSGVKISYFDPHKIDPETQKPGVRYVPYVIEPAAGLTRACLCFLLDAYTEEENDGKARTLLKLSPKIAPIKVAVLPLVKKDGFPERARRVYDQIQSLGLVASYDENQSIGKRYARHDEIGTPLGITIDQDTLDSDTVTVRDRDSTKQERVNTDQLDAYLKQFFKEL
jgi:glycyl-tRNA synthetase